MSSFGPGYKGPMGFGMPQQQPQQQPVFNKGQAAQAYLDATKQYKQSGGTGPRPRYADYMQPRQQPGMGSPMAQPPMPQQLGGGVMDRIKQLGGMGGQQAIDPRMQQESNRQQMADFLRQDQQLQQQMQGFAPDLSLMSRFNELRNMPDPTSQAQSMQRQQQAQALMQQMGGRQEFDRYQNYAQMQDPQYQQFRNQMQQQQGQQQAPGQMVPQQGMGGMGGGMDDGYQQFLQQQQQQQMQQQYQQVMGGQPQQGGYGPGISNYSAPQQGIGQPKRPMADYRQLLGQTPWTGGQFNPQGQQPKPMAQPMQQAPMAQPKPMTQPPMQQQAPMQQAPMQSQAMGMNMGGSVGMAPPNPYSQQVGQEDPRMQAMRNLQMMNFGG